METIILILVVVGLAAAAVWYCNRDYKSLDINQDGKIDTKDAVQVIKTTTQNAAQNVRDVRDAALVAAAESAMVAAGIIEKAKEKTKTVSKISPNTAAGKKSAAAKSRSKK